MTVGLTHCQFQGVYMSVHTKYAGIFGEGGAQYVMKTHMRSLIRAFASHLSIL